MASGDNFLVIVLSRALIDSISRTFSHGVWVFGFWFGFGVQMVVSQVHYLINLLTNTFDTIFSNNLFLWIPPVLTFMTIPVYNNRIKWNACKISIRKGRKW